MRLLSLLNLRQTAPVEKTSACLFLLVALTGCSTVTSTTTVTTSQLPYPQVFYVEDFSINLTRAVQEAEVSKRADYLGSLTEISRKLSAKLRAELMDLAPVYVLKPTDPTPRDGYIIRGDFLRLDAGSPAARSFVGFGAGQTKLIANVRMYRARQSSVPLERMDTKNIGREHDFRSAGITSDGLVMGINVRSGSGFVMSLPGAYHRLNDDAEAAAREISRRIRSVLNLPLK